MVLLISFTALACRVEDMNGFDVQREGKANNIQMSSIITIEMKEMREKKSIQ